MSKWAHMTRNIERASSVLEGYLPVVHKRRLIDMYILLGLTYGSQTWLLIHRSLSSRLVNERLKNIAVLFYTTKVSHNILQLFGSFFLFLGECIPFRSVRVFKTRCTAISLYRILGALVRLALAVLFPNRYGN